MGLIIYLWDESNYLSYYVSGLPFDAMLTKTNSQKLASPKHRLNECKQTNTAGISSHAYSVFVESIRSDFAPRRVSSDVLSFINQVAEWLLSLE